MGIWFKFHHVETPNRYDKFVEEYFIIKDGNLHYTFAVPFISKIGLSMFSNYK